MGGAMLAMSEGAWGFLGLLVAQSVALTALLINARRTRQDVKQVNRAVNHQPEGAPTLVERVGRIEKETSAHRTWEHAAFHALARHVGCELPPSPEEIDS